RYVSRHGSLAHPSPHRRPGGSPEGGRRRADRAARARRRRDGSARRRGCPPRARRRARGPRARHPPRDGGESVLHRRGDPASLRVGGALPGGRPVDVPGDVAGLGIPEGVREVIGRRLGRLSDGTNRILGLAAVIGRQFDVPLLAKIAETSEDAILDALDEATAAALVSEVRGSAAQFTFRHALIRTTLYEELSATRRAGVRRPGRQRRVGEALEDLVQAQPGTRIEELAYHWLAATQAADPAKAIGYARQAGERALAGLAFEEAAAHFERALAVLEPRGDDGKRL